MNQNVTENKLTKVESVKRKKKKTVNTNVLTKNIYA